MPDSCKHGETGMASALQAFTAKPGKIDRHMTFYAPNQGLLDFAKRIRQFCSFFHEE